MKASPWLAAVAAVLPGEKSAKRTSALRQFAPKLALDVPEWKLDNELADAVARRMGEGTSITYAVLLGAVRNALDERPDTPRRGGGTTTTGDPLTQEGREAHQVTDAWIRFVQRRLQEGGNRALLLSLIRTYCPREGYQRAMEILFPQELAEEKAAWGRRKAHMAEAAQRAAERAAKASAMPAGPNRQKPVTTRPLPPQQPAGPKAMPASREALIAGYRAQAQRDDALGEVAKARLAHLTRADAEAPRAAEPAMATTSGPPEPPPPCIDDYFQGREEDVA